MLGKKRSAISIIPSIRYEARIGSFYLRDRVLVDGVWEPNEKTIPNEDFQAVIDLKNILVGYIDFPTGAPPDTKLVAAGQDFGEPPTKKHKLGVRLLMKLGDGGLRELMSTAIGLWAGVDKLHDEYLAEAGKHTGKLPVVGIRDVIKTTISNGVSCEPVFVIEDWAERPPELPLASIPLSVPTAEKKPQRADMDDEIPF
jgi:hypothetical protein